ncbi:MAG: hypothetical protein U9R16_06140 [Campylobacterota bacterium]|nr:hypothetical protein [Campylobacterota bacterium]
MNKINPLFVLLFSFLLFIYSLISLNSSNIKLENIKDETKEYLSIATKYNSLNKAWGDSRDTKKLCEKILNSSNIKNAKIVSNGKSIKIQIKNSDKKSLDRFMNKILNETIVVLSFSLRKNSLDLEVGL